MDKSDYMGETCVRGDAASVAEDASPTTTAPATVMDAAHLPTSKDDAEHEQPKAGDVSVLNKQADLRPQHVSSTTLEGLAAELRIRILSSMPDLQALGTLVRASPVYHAQYRLDRKSLLLQILLKELGEDGFIDAYAAFKSRPSMIGPRKGPNTNVTDFLASYRHRRSPAGCKTMPGLCSSHDVVWMAWFYTSTVDPLIAQFVSWTHANLTSVPAKLMARSPESAKDLTRTERTRLLRAFYRFEIFCRLFGDGQYEVFIGVDVVDIFFSGMDFEPWEVEEMCCVYAFVKETYEETINDVRWDLDEDSPRFADVPPPEVIGVAFPLHEEEEFLNGTIGHGGLRLVLKMLKVKDHDQRVDLMTKSLRYDCSFFEDAMCFSEQRSWRLYMDRVKERDLAEQRRDAMPFAGDRPSAPPLAWVLLWGGKYSNLFGGYVPQELRQWGYVMWNRDRLNVNEAKKYLAEFWASSSALRMVADHFDWMCEVPKDLEKLKIDS